MGPGNSVAVVFNTSQCQNIPQAVAGVRLNREFVEPWLGQRERWVKNKLERRGVNPVTIGVVHRWTIEKRVSHVRITERVGRDQVEVYAVDVIGLGCYSPDGDGFDEQMIGPE